MNETQKIIQRAIADIKKIPKEYHIPKWRATVVKRLEETVGIASLVENLEHPHNQPLPEFDNYTYSQKDQGINIERKL